MCLFRCVCVFPHTHSFWKHHKHRVYMNEFYIFEIWFIFLSTFLVWDINWNLNRRKNDLKKLIAFWAIGMKHTDCRFFSFSFLFLSHLSAFNLISFYLYVSDGMAMVIFTAHIHTDTHWKSTSNRQNEIALRNGFSPCQYTLRELKRKAWAKTNFSVVYKISFRLIWVWWLFYNHNRLT